jgi:hypothetical protein
MWVLNEVEVVEVGASPPIVVVVVAAAVVVLVFPGVVTQVFVENGNRNVVCWKQEFLATPNQR